jgi:excinuclease UvrABC nuclease subunit
MKSQDLKKYKLPDSPGVYIFKQNKVILYVGKATSLRDRVRSYFASDLISTRGPLIVDMVYRANMIDFIKTDSVLEALILEANEIKKHQPKYNTKEKDNKSFNYVIITDEDFPRVLIIRGREIEKNLLYPIKEKFGPFTNSTQMQVALKIIRKIFPFRDKCTPNSGRPCFNRQIGLCPGVCDSGISQKDYRKIIKNISLFFTGKKKLIIRNLKKEMGLFARMGKYEMAGELRNKIFALNHIQDVALIDVDSIQYTVDSPRRGFRVEAYDLAHLSGTNNVGVMVVMENNEFKKSDYRKFIIRNSQGNDIGALQEMLERRLRHTEWPMPDLMVVDGGLAQLNIANQSLAFGMSKSLALVSTVAVTKNDRHKPKVIIGDERMIEKYKKQILLINNEVHRFAISFHRQKRSVIL